MITKDSSGSTIPASYATALAEGIVSYDCKLFLNGVELSGDIVALTVDLGSLSDAASDTDGFMLGGVYSTSADFSIYDCPTTILNEDIELRIGVKVSSSFIYVTVAHLTVISARTAANLTTAQAVGFISSKMAVPTLSGGTMSTSSLAAAIGTASGVQVDIAQFMTDSEDITIDSGTTCRDALAKLAKHLGGYACETNDGGVLVTPFPTSNTCSVSGNVMTSLPQIEDEAYEVDGITVQATENTFTEGTGRVPVEYADATQAIADQIWDNIDGYTYTPALLTIATLDPRITPFDKTTFTLDGVTYSTHTLGIQAKYDGGYFGTISAAGLSSAAEESLRTGHIESIATQAERAAAEAQAVAEVTGQHFWDDSDGAHVTEITKDEWQTEAAKPTPFPDASDQKPYPNLLMNSLGILLRSALKNLVSITRSAIAFYDGLGNDSQNVVASFGASGSQIGYSGQAHADIDSRSLTFTDQDDDVFFVVKDMRDADGEAEVAVLYIVPDPTYLDYIYVNTYLPFERILSVTVNGTTRTDYLEDGNTGIYFANPAGFAEGDEVEITFVTADSRAKQMTFGARTGNEGALSAAFGNGNEASGMYSLAGGNGNVARGRSSLAFGHSCEALSDMTIAMGNGAKAITAGQVAFGWFNDSSYVEGTNNIFSVGIGSDDANRENALAVGLGGDVYVKYLSMPSQSAGTIFMAPSSSAGKPSWRKLVAADIPTLATSKISGLGTIVEKAASYSSRATGTNINLSSISLTAGTWVVVACFGFASNATGVRVGKISTTSADSSTLTEGQATLAAPNGGASRFTVSRIMVLTATTTVYAVGYQSSGSSINGGAQMRAVRIK